MYDPEVKVFVDQTQFLSARKPRASLSCPRPSVVTQPGSRYSHNLSCPIDNWCLCFLLLLKLFPLLQPNQSAWWGRWILQISVTCGLYPWGRQLSPPFLFFFILQRSIFCSALSCTSCPRPPPQVLVRVRTVVVTPWWSFNQKAGQWDQLLWSCGLCQSLSEQFSHSEPFFRASITLPTSAL